MCVLTTSTLFGLLLLAHVGQAALPAASDEHLEHGLLHQGAHAGRKASGAIRDLLAHLPGSLQASSEDKAHDDELGDVQAMPRALMAAKKKKKTKKSKTKPASSTVRAQVLDTTGIPAGIDTSGSTAPWGTCQGIDASEMGSSWCNKGPLPDGPSDPSLKLGRQSIYGTSSGGRGWCGVPLTDGTANAIAISTKYLPLYGTSPNSDYCGKCMCIRIKSPDTTSNQFPTPAAQQYCGKVFKGVVADMCPECCDDQIDVLSAKPYTDTVPPDVAYGVGVWVVEWNFIPSCDIDCDQWFASKK